jgi:hypothetical protein
MGDADRATYSDERQEQKRGVSLAKPATRDPIFCILMLDSILEDIQDKHPLPEYRSP